MPLVRLNAKSAFLRARMRPDDPGAYVVPPEGGLPMLRKTKSHQVVGKARGLVI